MHLYEATAVSQPLLEAVKDRVRCFWSVRHATYWYTSSPYLGEDFHVVEFVTNDNLTLVYMLEVLKDVGQ